MKISPISMKLMPRFGKLTLEQRQRFDAAKDSFQLSEDMARNERRKQYFTLEVFDIFERLNRLSDPDYKPAPYTILDNQDDLEWALIEKLKRMPVMDPIINEKVNEFMAELPIDEIGRVSDYLGKVLYTYNVLHWMGFWQESELHYQPSDAVWAALTDAAKRCGEPNMLLTWRGKR